MCTTSTGIKTVKYAARPLCLLSKFIWYWTPLRHIQEQDQYWMRPMPYHHIKSISALKISFAWRSSWGSTACENRDISTYFRIWNFFSFLFDWQQLLVLVRWFTSNFSKERKNAKEKEALSLICFLLSPFLLFLCVVHNNYIKPSECYCYLPF